LTGERLLEDVHDVIQLGAILVLPIYFRNGSRNFSRRFLAASAETDGADASVGIDDGRIRSDRDPSFLLHQGYRETSRELYDYGHRPAGR